MVPYALGYSEGKKKVGIFFIRPYGLSFHEKVHSTKHGVEVEILFLIHGTHYFLI